MKLSHVIYLIFLAHISLSNGRSHPRLYNKSSRRGLNHGDSPAPAPPQYKTDYIEQQLDHFNYANNLTWNERYLYSGEEIILVHIPCQYTLDAKGSTHSYYVLDVFWGGEGPLFLLCIILLDVWWRRSFILIMLLDVFWGGEGPLFFYTGNEGPIEEFYANTGFLFTLAEELKAMIVFAEHVSTI